jgi:hypothetical protein
VQCSGRIVETSNLDKLENQRELTQLEAAQRQYIALRRYGVHGRPLNAGASWFAAAERPAEVK